MIAVALDCECCKCTGIALHFNQVQSIWKILSALIVRVHGRMSNSTNVNISTKMEESSPATPVPRSLAIVVFVLLSILIFAGTSGNAFACNLLRRHRDLRKVPHYLLASLCLTGLLTSIFAMPSLLMATIVNYLQASHIPVAQTLCTLGFPLSVGCVALNALTITLMTIDHHDCVVRPFRRRLSTQNVKKILSLTWLVGFIIAAVLLVLLRKETSVCFTWFPYEQSKSFQTEQGNVIRIYLTAITQLDTLAIVLVIFTFFRALKEIRSLIIPQSTNSTLQKRQEKQLTRLTYVISGTYILFRLPLIASHIVMSAAEFQGKALNTVFLLTNVMAYSTFVLNPLLYCKMLRVRQPNRVDPVVT